MRKQILNKLSIALLLLAALTGCDKTDEVGTIPPIISNLEIGHNNSKITSPGGDLHIDGEVMASGIIANIKVKITPEVAEGWTFEETFTEGYEGAKNADFHQDIEVPEDAAVGEYHLQVIVTDHIGNISEAESNINIEAVDPALTTLEQFDVNYDSNNKMLNIKGNILAPNKIAELSIEVHNDSFEKEYPIDNEDYIGKETYELNQQISIEDIPAGHYHLHLVVIDQLGNEKEFENHFDK